MGMLREEAKEVFLNRGFIDGIYDGDKWRDACIVISEWLKEEPRSEWEQDHAILKAYSDGVNEVLDKIRAEIIENSIEDYKYHGCGTDELIIETSEVLRVLDKYKAETEQKDVKA